jgi:hypothetical protein
VTWASLMFHCNPYGELGDRLVESLSLARGLSSSRVVLEKSVWYDLGDLFGD